MESLISLALIAAAAFMLLFLIRILTKPIRWAAKLFLNTLAGFVSLFALNFIGGFIGIGLGMNWVNALVVGVLGMPGVVLLLLLKYLL